MVTNSFISQKAR